MGLASLTLKRVRLVLVMGVNTLLMLRGGRAGSLCA